MRKVEANMCFLPKPLVCCLLVAAEKYSSLAMGSVLMVMEPCVQFAGQTSPCASYAECIKICDISKGKINVQQIGMLG